MIDYDENKDCYFVNENSIYKNYESLLGHSDSGKEAKTVSKNSTGSEDDQITNIENFSVKEIIYISEGSNATINVILRGIINKEFLFLSLNELESIISNNMINMTLNRDKNDLFKLIIELEINIDVYDCILKSLKDKNWKMIE